MSEVSEITVLGLQESENGERKARTLLEILKEDEEMNGVEERRGRWRSLKQRLGFKVIGCCGATWGFNAASDMSLRDEEEAQEQEPEEEELQRLGVGQIPAQSTVDSEFAGRIPVVNPSSRMNLAAALAAERHIRAAAIDNSEGFGTDGTTGATMVVSSARLRISLMRLLDEKDGEDEEERERGRDKEEDDGRNDWVCCVCMERRKGAAFIPCGHTFCRCCSRDLWLNRGTCPICNHSIVEILDIF